MEWRDKQFKSAIYDASVEIINKIANALDFAHSREILHRDIKPNNIIVYWNCDKQELDVKVLDFGLAASLKESLKRLEYKPHSTEGTLPYMAPEQWKMDTLGVGTDVYALAVLAHQFLYESLPYEAVFRQGDFHKIYDAVCNGEIQLHEKICPEIETVLRRGLAKKLRDRYYSCGEFAKEYALAVKASLTREKRDNESEWKMAGNILKHPLVKQLSNLNLKRNDSKFYVYTGAYYTEFMAEKFWKHLSVLIRNLTPYQLIHANEVLSLSFSDTKDRTEQIIYEISEAVKADVAKKYLEHVREREFKISWCKLIDWAKLMGEVLMQYPYDSDGVLESMKALKERIDKSEEEKRMKNITRGNLVFKGNPFYRKSVTPEIILCEYYLEKLGEINT